MRFLANENFPVPSIRRLREAGHDVAAVIEDNRGCSDAEVMARAVAEERIIITFDRDYGELIYRLGLLPPLGVIYLRYAPRSPVEPASQLTSLFQAQDLTFVGKFTVIKRDQIRQRPLPSQS